MDTSENTEHIAFLTGGPDRVIELVVALLLERKAIRISRDGTLRSGGRRPGRRTELEGLVLAAVETGSGRSVRTLKQDFTKHALVLDMEKELVGRGLLRRWRWWSMLDLRRTRAGDYAVSDAEDAIGGEPSTAAVHVALHGIGAYPAPGVARAFRSKANSLGSNDYSGCGTGGFGSG